MSDLEVGAMPGRDEVAQFQGAFDDGGVQAVLSLLRGEHVSMFGKKSCPYCMEAKRVLQSTLNACDGGELVCLWIEDVKGGSALFSQMKQELGCSTVPMIFIGGEFVGGCDSVTKMRSKGELLARVCNALGDKGHDTNQSPEENLQDPKDDLDSFTSEEKVEDLYIPDERFFDAHSAPALTEHAAKAYSPLFYLSLIHI